MFPVDNIRKACKEKGTSLAEVERALGIGNGVIARWGKSKGSPPYDRIVAIASYLGVSVETLTGEAETPAPADADAAADLMFALWGGDSHELSDEDLQDVMNYAAYVLERKRKGKK